VSTRGINLNHTIDRIYRIDVLVGALSGRQPRFSQPTLFPRDLLDSRYPKIADSPLNAGRTLKIALKGSHFGQKGIAYLQRAQILTMLRLSGGSSSDFVDETEFSEAGTEHHNSKLFQVIQQTSVIYFGALQTPSIPFSSPVNRMSIREVCRAVESPANDTVWDQYPGIFIWVLLVGCAAAEQGLTEYNYFVCLLIKVALGAGYGWLDALTEAVKSFIRVKALAGG
jgi:hypothetical protein